MSGVIINEGETVLIYADKEKRFWASVADSAAISLIASIYLFLIIQLPSFLSQLPSPPSTSPSINIPLVLYICLAVFITLFSNLVITALELKDQPAVVLSQEGLTVYNSLLKIGPIRWDEIAETRIIEVERGDFVGIIPFDTDQLCKRLGGSAAWLIPRGFFIAPLLFFFRRGDELLALVRIPKVYRMYSLISTPIVIWGTHLPLSADELAARIREYKTRMSAW